MGTAIFACSSSDPLVFIGSGAEDAGPTGSFVTTDAGAGADGATSPTPDPDSVKMCVATECPAPFETCPTGSGGVPNYACDTDTASDVDNCGGCGLRCLVGAPDYHYVRACVKGTCQPYCQPGYSDCNGIPDDGCESDPATDSNNCGFCGNKCASGVACIDGKCGCPPGQTNCDGTCVDLANDDSSCGSCGFRCIDHQPEDAGAGTVPPNMFYGCKQGACTDLRCYRDSDVFWSDCNGDTKVDGCEINLKKPNADHCGKCGNACDDNQQCFSSSETGMDCQCKGGKTICSDNSGSACVDLDNDPRNCGSCGYACPTIDGADIACSHGRCGYTCKPGMADCNGRPDDGCEVLLAKDPRNCGACGTSCDVGAGQPCVGGQCVTKDCDAGPVK